MEDGKCWLDFRYTTRPLAYITKIIGLILIGSDESLHTEVIVYSNSQKLIIDIAEKIEHFFDADDRLHMYDAIVIHGRLNKVKKAWSINYYIMPSHPEDKNIHFMCAASGVDNDGIDSSK
eukprot:5044048-Ditylum_brightwellii.AAC.1